MNVIPSFATELSKLRNKVKRRSTPAVCFEDACYRDVSFSIAAPLLEQEGWTRPKENAAKHPLTGADGVVAHRNAVGMLSERMSVSDHPGASRHPSCTRRGARARTVFLIWTALPSRRRGGCAINKNGPVPNSAQPG